MAVDEFWSPAMSDARQFRLLIIAAIAIPNLLRSTMAANEASAVGSLRTYNTAMVRYSRACPEIGYPASFAWDLVRATAATWT